MKIKQSTEQAFIQCTLRVPFCSSVTATFSSFVYYLIRNDDCHFFPKAEVKRATEVRRRDKTQHDGIA